MGVEVEVTGAVGGWRVAGGEWRVVGGRWQVAGGESESESESLTTSKLRGSLLRNSKAAVL